MFKHLTLVALAATLTLTGCNKSADDEGADSLAAPPSASDKRLPPPPTPEPQPTDSPPAPAPLADAQPGGAPDVDQQTQPSGTPTEKKPVEKKEPWEPPAEQEYDPNPVESASAPAAPESAKAAAQRQVVAFSEGQDPFATLGAPTVQDIPEDDPRSDTLRLGPQVPPEPGETVMQFPPAETPGEVPPAVTPPPLTVVRHSPEGEADQVAAVTASFSQPMVPLASLEDLADKPSPLTLTPQPEGRFSWLGTDTVAFEPTHRMPFATTYTATVAKGTASAAGSNMAADFSWSFTTPRPRVVSISPYDGQEEVLPETTVQLTFNAAVDPETVVANVRLEGGGNLFELAVVPSPAPDPEEEAKKDPLTRREGEWDRARTVTLKPVAPLPTGTPYVVTTDKKLTCAEGPLPASESQTFKFATYYPLKITKISCSWDDDDCYPGSAVNIEFNNGLEAKKVDELISLTPKPNGLRYRVSGRTVTAYAEFMPSMTYAVKVEPGILDVHGQRNADGAQKTVRYAEANPFLQPIRQGIAVVEANQSHDFLITSMNLGDASLKMAVVPPDQVARYVDRANSWYDWEDNPLQGLEPNIVRTLTLSEEDNRIARTYLNLDDSLGKNGRGFVMLDLKTRRSRGLFKGWNEYRAVALIQVTNLGITAALSDEEMLVLMTTLDEGATVEGVALTLIRQETGEVVANAITDEAGVARLSGPKRTDTFGPYILLARKGKDRAFLSISGSTGTGYISSYAYQTSFDPKQVPATFVFTDRKLYKPSEEVNVNVIARMRNTGPKGDLVPIEPGRRDFAYTVNDPRGNEVASGSLILSPFGTGSFSLKTEKNAPLGTYYVELSSPSASASGNFDVQEFRTPEYKTGVSWAKAGENILVRRELDAKITGKYFFGAPMASADVDWRLVSKPSKYSPPGNDGFSFSDIDPANQTSPWGYYDDYGYRGTDHVASGSGNLDANGSLQVPVTLDPGNNRRDPISFTLEAEVYDRNRQSIAARSTVLAHRAERYVGVSLDRSVVAAGETTEISGIVTRLDGSRYNGADVDIALMLTSWDEEEVLDSEGNVSYEHRYRETEAAACKFKAAATPGKCMLTVPGPGTYLVRALSKDRAGRPARSAVRLYAYGDGESSWTSGGENRVEIVADRKHYDGGDTARLLLRSPFKDAVGMVMVSREGFLKVEPVRITNGTAAFELSIKERWMPSVHVAVALVRGRTEEPGKTADDRGRPAYAHGSATLNIERNQRAIAIALKPSATAIQPGGSFNLELTATDTRGAPVQANVALMVVDEGVLSLIGYVTPNPLKALYTAVSGNAGFVDLRPLVVPRAKPKPELSRAENEEDSGALKEMVQSAAPPGAFDDRGMLGGAKPEAKMKKSRARKGGRNGGDDDSPAFALRKLFKSTAYFNGNLRTDESGRLSIEVKMPDNLTEFRVMAVAADEGVKFGSADTQVRTRRPLIVRPALPRFLNFGDKFEAAAVVNNETGFDTQVMVRCLAANATLENNTATVDAKAGEAVEVRFKATAGNPGPATFQFAAVALTNARDTDAAEVTIPTLIPATSEAFATYGVVDTAVRQPLQPPKNALPGFGGLDVDFSSTALTGLQDAVGYLFDYPYECTEQTCSRILPIMALGDIIRDFNLGKAGSPEEAKKLVEEGIVKILLNQRGDGGFGYWSSSRRSWLYVSAYAAMTLQLAQKKGYKVDQYRLEQVASFLEERLDSPYEWEALAYGSQTMAALVLARMDRPPIRHLKRLSKLATERTSQTARDAANPLSLYARAWLLEAVALAPGLKEQEDELYRQLANSGVETAAALHFSEEKRESLKLMMHSEDRTDAIVLGALLAVRPDDSMIEKVVRGLVRSRIKGRWATTQANAYALLALSKYYEIFEKDEPDFEARLWHGTTYLTGRKFQGREMTIAKTSVPMKALFDDAAADLIVAKTGPGRLYYRLGLKYAPSDLELAAEDRGFLVERTYLPEGEDSKLEKDDQGRWVAKAGSYVRVKIRVVAPDRRYYVAVIDPMPAGFEAVNEAFATSATTRTGKEESSSHRTGRRHWYWNWNPWDFEEKRDDRVQLFADRMYGGVHEYTYVVRATTIGEFVVPPTRAEEMYSPEVFGRASTERMLIVP